MFCPSSRGGKPETRCGQGWLPTSWDGTLLKPYLWTLAAVGQPGCPWLMPTSSPFLPTGQMVLSMLVTYLFFQGHQSWWIKDPLDSSLTSS